MIEWGWGWVSVTMEVSGCNVEKSWDGGAE